MRAHTRRTVLGILLLATALSHALAQAPPKADDQKAPPSPKALVESMAADEFAGVRASRELAALGEAALPALVEGTRHGVPRVRYWSIAAIRQPAPSSRFSTTPTASCVP